MCERTACWYRSQAFLIAFQCIGLLSVLIERAPIPIELQDKVKGIVHRFVPSLLLTRHGSRGSVPCVISLPESSSMHHLHRLVSGSMSACRWSYPQRLHRASHFSRTCSIRAGLLIAALSLLSWQPKDRDGNQHRLVRARHQTSHPGARTTPQSTYRNTRVCSKDIDVCPDHPHYMPLHRHSVVRSVVLRSWLASLFLSVCMSKSSKSCARTYLSSSQSDNCSPLFRCSL